MEILSEIVIICEVIVLMISQHFSLFILFIFIYLFYHPILIVCDRRSHRPIVDT